MELSEKLDLEGICFDDYIDRTIREKRDICAKINR